ncbi:MAG: prolipoprotein diacylglyceryl transferase [Deltaproteobacteria bacterium HGW-Deltaproteobacteria-13]|jgi:prolipoprotein diacylglyceryl transferase|nr:MAG: prolipoprotein diacylglyceryl transferase [Deltaproteobacteria bacterium HGW-Deltaproteobacteria-13]
MNGFVWNVDPDIFVIGPIHLRYYGILLGITLVVGYYFFQKQMKKYGYSEQVSLDYLFWGMLSTFIGARLVHCYFYETSHFIYYPLDVFKIWKGGISSHGATVGLFISAIWFARSRKIPFAILGDGIVFAAALGAILFRIGNFMNSEIVGRVTTVPWGVHFMRYTDHGLYLRHPSQLYEAAGGLIVLLSLFAVEYFLKGKKRPGLFSGVFLIEYFTFRFFVEYFKEFQIDPNNTFPLTMGQCLSIPFVVIGIFILIYSLRLKPEAIESMVVKEIPEKTESKKASAKKKKTMEKQNKREKKF